MTEYRYLTVRPEFGEEIKSIEGRNDTERLHKWAKQKDFKEDSNTVQSNREYIETVVEEKIQDLKERGII